MKTAKYFNSLEEMSGGCARTILDTALKYASEKKLFTLAVSGGTTPVKLFSLMAAKPFSDEFPWKNTHIFWVDERHTSHDAPESNFGTACKILFSKVPVPAENIHPVKTENIPPAESAALYEKELKKIFKPENDSLPSIDLVLLGMGSDGHTASLFPYAAALDETGRWVTDVPPPAKALPALPRITLTYPIINNAKNIFFLIGGEERRKLAETFLNSNIQDFHQYPAAGICGDGNLTWFISRN
ncbi:MAG: 6-phosphogluconolactonase [Lentisphaerae bacterium GWF2_44_16]|nr:MAG: 6-phosphogluconolactonase [Lentisphaerae bacterium GWF2_44_16]